MVYKYWRFTWIYSALFFHTARSGKHLNATELNKRHSSRLCAKPQKAMGFYVTKAKMIRNSASIKKIGIWRTRWQRSGRTWNTSVSTDTSGIYFQTQKCIQNTSWEWTGVPDQWKRICRTMQNSVGWRSRGKRGVLVGPDLSSAGGGTEAGVQSPHQGNCLSQRRNI